MTEKIPYINKSSAIKEFLSKVQETGVPPRVSQREYLPTIGFTSSSDRPLLPLFKFLGFLDSSGAPTELYKSYRDKKKAPKVLAKAIKSAYSGLYGTYADAHKQDSEALANYFRPTTGLGDDAVASMVTTFKALCTLADFSGSEEGEGEEEEEETPPRKRASRQGWEFAAGIPSVSINIQLQLPATENEEIYDKLFAALRKHLYPQPDKEK